MNDEDGKSLLRLDTFFSKKRNSDLIMSKNQSENNIVEPNEKKVGCMNVY
jgi:hypothetical protein